MPLRWCGAAILALLCCALLFPSRFSTAEPTSLEVAELLKLQKRSADGVISMDTATWKKYLSGRSRSYSAVVFSSAQHLLDKPNLRLRELRSEFGYMAKGYKADRGTHGKVFCFEIEFLRTSEVFTRLPTKSLPYIFHIPPQLSLEGGGGLKLTAKDAMQPADYQAYPWTAHDMGGWTSEATGVKADKIVRPSLLTHWSFPIVVLSVLATGGAVAYKLYYAPFMKHHFIWASGIIFVYFFSVSGGMHNIIRGVPMQHFDPRSGKAVLFLKTGQSQLGAEGFIMGALYTAIGLSIALLTHGAPQLPSKLQRPVSFGIIVVAGFFYLKVKETYSWKTSYVPRWFI